VCDLALPHDIHAFDAAFAGSVLISLSLSLSLSLSALCEKQSAFYGLIGIIVLCSACVLSVTAIIDNA
jgi:hypothetical protein